MKTVLLLVSRVLLAAIDTLSTLLGALGVRWLFGYSTPEKDWQTVRAWWESFQILVILPDPMAGINLAYLTRMRERYDAGAYTADKADEIQSVVPEILKIVIETAPDAPITDESHDETTPR